VGPAKARNTRLGPPREWRRLLGLEAIRNISAKPWFCMKFGQSLPSSAVSIILLERRELLFYDWAIGRPRAVTALEYLEKIPSWPT